MPTKQYKTPNYATFVDPEIATDEMNLQRKMALAKALTEQGMSPLNTDRAYAISPLEGVAKMAQALAGVYLGNKADDALEDVAKKKQDFYNQAFGFSPASSTSAPDPKAIANVLKSGNTQPSQPQSPNLQMLSQVAPDAYAKMLIERQNETFGAPVETAEGKFIQAGNRGTVKPMEGYSIPKQYQQAQLGNRIGAFDPTTGNILDMGGSGTIGVSPNVSATLPIQRYNAETSRMNAKTDIEKLGLEQQKFKQEQEGDATPNLTPEGFGKVVDKVIAGEIELPKNTRTPYWQSVMEAAAKKDPTFNQADYATRLATKKGFTSGKQADAVNAINTVVGHMGKLNEAIEELDNFRFPSVNKSWNKMSSGIGGTSVKKFETAVLPVAQELTRVYRGAGGSEKDIEETMRNLNVNDSYAQQKEALKTLVGLLGSKLEALTTQYNQGMKTSKQGFELLTPESQQVLNSIMGLQSGQSQTQPQASQTSKIKFMGFE